MTLPSNIQPRYALNKTPLPRTATLIEITDAPPRNTYVTRATQAEVDI